MNAKTSMSDVEANAQSRDVKGAQFTGDGIHAQSTGQECGYKNGVTSHSKSNGSSTNAPPTSNSTSSNATPNTLNDSAQTSKYNGGSNNTAGTQAGTHGYITEADVSSDKRIHAAKAAHKRVAKVVWIVAGPAGCGKSSVGQYIAKQLDIPFLEADDFHPQANKDKMANGTPLTDEDRKPWLASLQKAASETVSENNGVVLTCSALKRAYRDVLRQIGGGESIEVAFVFLAADEDEIERRVRARKGHFMKAEMVHSQFVVMETPESDDEEDVIRVNTQGKGLTEVEQLALGKVHDKLAEMTR